MKKAIRYALTLCLFSWASVGVAVGCFGMNRTSTPMGYFIFCTGYMLCPLLVAIVLQVIDKERFNKTGLVNFKPKWSWLIAWVLPVVMTFLCILVNGLFPGVEIGYGAEQMIAQGMVPEQQQEMARAQMAALSPVLAVVNSVVSAFLAGATVNALFAFGEEYGWRNYLVEALGERRFWTASLFIGFVWGIWHFPIILMGHNYPDQPGWGVPLMVVFCLLWGVIELYFLLKTKSVIVPAVIHGTLNAIAGVALLFVKGGNGFINGMTGLSGFIVMGLVILFLWLFDKHVAKEGIFVKTLDESLNR